MGANMPPDPRPSRVQPLTGQDLVVACVGAFALCFMDPFESHKITYPLEAAGLPYPAHMTHFLGLLPEVFLVIAMIAVSVGLYLKIKSGIVVKRDVMTRAALIIATAYFVVDNSVESFQIRYSANAAAYWCQRPPEDKGAYNRCLEVASPQVVALLPADIQTLTIARFHRRSIGARASRGRSVAGE
jgi:hypothetical protein